MSKTIGNVIIAGDEVYAGTGDDVVNVGAALVIKFEDGGELSRALKTGSATFTVFGTDQEDTARLGEVTALAADTVKLKRTDVFSLIVDLIEAGGTTDGHILAKVLRSFVPSARAKPRTVERWASLAVARGGDREYLKSLYSDGTRLMASNGAVAHVTGTTLPVGYYNSALQTVCPTLAYPDIDRIIPRYTSNPLPDLSALPVAPYVLGRTPRLKISVAPDYWVDRVQFEEAMSCPSPLANICGGKGGSIRLDFEDGSLAVLSPIKGG